MLKFVNHMGLKKGKATMANEQNSTYAMQLHLELQESQLRSMSTEEADILFKYGKVKKSISRDIIVPSSLTLHQLHFLINVAFGWTNSHLHSFQLPKPLFEKLTEGKLLDIAPIFGYYLQFPNSTFDDAFWDDDYDESKSPRTWMRSKYLKRYKYKGYSQYWIENQTEIATLAKSIPVLKVHSFHLSDEVKPREVKIEDATLQDLLGAIIFDNGTPDELKESLRLDEILSLNPTKIEKAKENIFLIDTNDLKLYSYYRDSVITGQIQEDGPTDVAQYFYGIRKMEKLQKEFEPKVVAPITKELLYRYDYGDGWEVEIELVGEFGKGGKSVEHEVAQQVIEKRKPICIVKDGLNVLDDCGNVYGYKDMLETIYEGEAEEAMEMKAWARSQGWTGRDVSPKNLV